MVQIGAPSVVLETEHVQQMSNHPDWGAAVAHAQKTIMEDYHDEYGIKCALRHTIGDIREDRDYLKLQDKFPNLMEAFDQCAKNGAELLASETVITSYSIHYTKLYDSSDAKSRSPIFFQASSKSGLSRNNFV